MASSPTEPERKLISRTFQSNSKVSAGPTWTFGQSRNLWKVRLRRVIPLGLYFAQHHLGQGTRPILPPATKQPIPDHSHTQYSAPFTPSLKDSNRKTKQSIGIPNHSHTQYSAQSTPSLKYPNSSNDAPEQSERGRPARACTCKHCERPMA